MINFKTLDLIRKTLRWPQNGLSRVCMRGMIGGAKGDRTPDLLHAMQALSQLSYGPLNYGW